MTQVTTFTPQTRQRLAAQLTEGVDTLGLTVDEAQRTQLIDYLALLTRWNRAYNLTAVREPEDMVVRHLLDALAVSPYITPTGRMADVGSGPGIPGIMLAIVHPALELTLIDSNLKMTRFARQAIRHLQLPNAVVERTRVEEGDFAPFEQIISRAFASISDYLSLTADLLTDDGRIWAMKGRWRGTEAKTLPTGCEIVQNRELHVPGLDAERHLIEIKLNRGQR